MKAKTTKYGELKVIFTEAEANALRRLMAHSSSAIRPDNSYTEEDESLIGWPLYEATIKYLES